MSKPSRRKPPRALVHKKILTAAEENPDAAIQDLATEVAGASPQLVERVLEEYGDPVESATMENQDTTINLDELTDQQRETLEAIHEHPDATQKTLAEELGVSSATISQRLSGIEGFDWQDRGPIVRDLFVEQDEKVATVQGEDVDEETGESEATAEANGFEEIESRLQKIEEAVDTGLIAVQSEVDERFEELEMEIEDHLDNGEGSCERLAEIERDIESVNETGRSVVERVEDLEETVSEQGSDGSMNGSSVTIEDDELVAKVIRAVIADDAITGDEELRVIQALQ